MPKIYLRQRCESLFDAGSRDRQRRVWKALFEQDKLWEGCLRALHDKMFADLERSYDLLNDPSSLDLVLPVSGTTEAETARLLGLARRVAAATLVALLVKTDAAAWDNLFLWAARAADMDPPLGSFPCPTRRSTVQDCFCLLAEHSHGMGRVGEARAAVLQHLLGDLQPKNRLSGVPILTTVEAESEGRLIGLSLDLLPDGFGEVFASPRMLGTFDAEWWHAVNEVARQVQVSRGSDVQWSIVAKAGPVRFQGRSGQAAFRAALELLLRGEPYDCEYAISAEVGADNRLRPVDGITGGLGRPGLKLTIARKAGLKCVILCPEDDRALPQDARDALVAEGLEVREAETVDQAVSLVSRQARALQAYCDWVIGLPDRFVLGPAYLGGRCLSQLFIWPDVLKHEREGGSEVERWGAGDAPEDTAPEEEQEVVADKRRGPERVPWRREWEEHSEDAAPFRVALLGPAGQGKSLLVKMTLRALARRSRDRLLQHYCGTGRLDLPLFVPLNVLAAALPPAASEKDLRQGLITTLEKLGCPEPDLVAPYLANHAHEARTWLFLDALDEVPDPSRLTILFKALQDWRCRALLTSRAYAYEAGRLPFATEYYLTSFSPEQSRGLITRWFRQDGDRPRKQQDHLLDLLKRSPSIQDVSKNPFMLTLLCAAAEGQDLSGSTTRTELFEHILRDLLAQPRGGDGQPDFTRANALLRLLADVALQLFREKEDTPVRPFRREHLCDAIAASEERPWVQGWTEEQHAGLSRSAWAQSLLDELCRKRLLVPLTSNQDIYTVPHASVLEYLRASAFAGEVSRRAASVPSSRTLVSFLDGSSGALAFLPASVQRWLFPPSIQLAWRRFHILRSRAGPVWRYVDGKAWDPAWEQLLLFFAGLLKEEHVCTFLSLLAAEREDDLFRHRLALAAGCLAEIPAGIRQSQAETIDAITASAFECWWRHQLNGTVAAVPHLTRILPALGQVNGALHGQPLLDWLTEQLRAPALAVRRAALRAVSAIGTAAAQPVILEAMAKLLRAPEEEVRATAVQALRRLGGAAATAEHLGRLAELLGDANAAVRRAAAETVRGMGSAAATPAFLGRVRELLHRLAPDYRAEAARAAEGIGPEAGTEEIVILIASLLKPDQPVGAKQAAAQAVGSIGARAGKKVVLDRLSGLLRAPEPEVRSAAAAALRGIGSSAARKRTVDRLIELLCDENQAVRRTASWAVRGIGTAPSRKKVLSMLARYLRAHDSDIRRRAARAVGNIGSGAARRDILRLLQGLLTDRFPGVRAAAVQALGSLGRAVSEYRPEALPAVARLLRDENPFVLRDAVLAAGALNLGTPECLHRFLSLVQYTRSDIRRIGATALGIMNETIASDATLQAIGELLTDPDDGVAISGMEALRKLGPPATRPFLLDRLRALLAHRNPACREAAAATLGDLMIVTSGPDLATGLLKLLRDSNASVQGAAAAALGNWMTRSEHPLRMFRARRWLPRWLVHPPVQLSTTHDLTSNMRRCSGSSERDRG